MAGTRILTRYVSIAPMFSLIRTLRPLNLGIILLTMLVLEYGLIAPILRTLPFHEGSVHPFVTSRIQFALLILSTLLVAGAGNIINDYFDLRADRVNKPEKVLIGKHLERRTAMLTHFLLNSIAILIALWISWSTGVWFVLLLQIFAAGVLWFYSLYLKHQPLIGNLMIALITAMIPLLLLLFEFIPLYVAYGGELFADLRDAALSDQEPAARLQAVSYWCLAYSGFAFITTLIRELQKDLADLPGDRKVGSRTLPIVMGEKRTSNLTIGLILLFCSGSILSWYVFLGDLPSLLYILGAIGAPALGSAGSLLTDRNRKGYERASDLMKLTMLMGILFPIFAYLLGPERIYF